MFVVLSVAHKTETVFNVNASEHVTVSLSFKTMKCQLQKKGRNDADK